MAHELLERDFERTVTALRDLVQRCDELLNAAATGDPFQSMSKCIAHGGLFRAAFSRALHVLREQDRIQLTRLRCGNCGATTRLRVPPIAPCDRAGSGLHSWTEDAL